MISVIIPIFNAGKSLQRTINCLLQQEEKNFEVILVNDGSSDNTAQICDAISREDRRFHVIHQKNEGVSLARNKGIEVSTGNYITFIDADDEIGPEYLKNLRDLCKKKSCDIAICDVVMVENNKEVNRFTHHEVDLDQTEALNFLLSRKIINSGPCAKMFKREIIEDLVFPKLKVYEDILFVKDAFCEAKTISITNRTEYRYIQNDFGAMQKFKNVLTNDIIVATEKIVDFINNRTDMEPDTFYISLSHLMQYVQSIPNYDREETEAFVEEAKKLYRNNLKKIWLCKSFPWKEKIVFTMFVCGFLYVERRIIKV